MIQPEYNGKAIQIYRREGRQACIEYIKTIPLEFQKGAVSAVATIVKASKRAK
jgi:hypothetical protein